MVWYEHRFVATVETYTGDLKWRAVTWTVDYKYLVTHYLIWLFKNLVSRNILIYKCFFQCNYTKAKWREITKFVYNFWSLDRTVKVVRNIKVFSIFFFLIIFSWAQNIHDNVINWYVVVFYNNVWTIIEFFFSNNSDAHMCIVLDLQLFFNTMWKW